MISLVFALVVVDSLLIAGAFIMIALVVGQSRATLRRVEALEVSMAGSPGEAALERTWRKAADRLFPEGVPVSKPASSSRRMLDTALFVKRLYSGTPVGLTDPTLDDLAAPPVPFDDATGMRIWREAVDRAVAAGWKPISMNNLDARIAALEERAAASDRWVAEGPARRQREFEEAMEAIRAEGESRASAARVREAEERSPS